MAGERVKLAVSERTKLGSAETRRLRKQGIIPGVLYGQVTPIAIAVGERELRAALTTPSGAHAVLDLAIDGGGSHSAVLKEFQRDKVRGNITHIDLQEVRLDVLIHATVSVTLIGEPVGVDEGGVLSHVTTELNISALPLEVPQHIDADVSGLGIGDSLRASAISLPSGVTLLDDPEETVLATVTHGAPVEGAAEDGEGAEAADGEEPEASAEDANEASASDAASSDTAE